jgi:Zn finger protein HypA/HybF involved in hydrogenase expression
MHELSIAGSILDLADRHVPAGAKLISISMIAGPMRAIDSSSMDWAWQAVLQERNRTGIVLNLVQLPWTLRCTTCGREWTAADLDSPCPAGHAGGSPVGGDELRITGIEVDEG